MALTNLISGNTVSYTVKNQPGWFYESLLKPKTIAGGYVRVLPNVTKDTRVKKLVISENTISQEDDRDCAWTPIERLNLSEKTFQVKNFKINIEQCLEELDNIYSENTFNSIGATKDKWPAEQGESLEDAVMFLLQNSLGNDIERLIWGGTGNAVDGVQNGIIDKLAADPDSIKVQGQAIDSTNVVGEIEKVYNAIPDVVLQDADFEPEKAKVQIFVDIKTMRYLKQALATQPTNYQVILPKFTVEGGKYFYMGVEIVMIPIFPANTMVAGSKDNLVFVTDLLSDTQELRVRMGADLRDENIVFVKGAYRADAGYIFGNELVIYQR